MNSYRSCRAALLGLAMLFVVASPVLAKKARYTVTDLGILPVKLSTVLYGDHSINNNGEVVGHCNDGDNSNSLFGSFFAGNVALLWTKQRGIQALPLLPDKAYASAFTVNERGQVLGLAGNSWDDAHAVLWEKGTVRDLGTLPGDTSSYLQGINNRGQIVGSSEVRAGDLLLRERPVVWEGGLMLPLPMGGYVAGQALDVNDDGQITGQLRTYVADFVTGAVPVLWDDRKGLTFLSTLPGNWGAAWAINNRGQIAGYSGYADGSSHAVLWANGVMTDLGSLGGSWGVLWDINNTGQAVGDSTTVGDLADHAILVENGAMADLNDLIAPGSGWVLLAATGVNDRGQISGSGIHNGEVRAFLLTPAK